ncbi:MAG: hypothetical protein PF489_02355 [Salinivirgaceae bacterium]|jgi:aspartate kinase|nr:hypothetical protein [Salinivirgaceae bacterium]
MQSITVHKLGGSTLKTPQQLSCVIPSIGINTGKKVIVVSALFGVTDLIITALESKENHPEIIKRLYDTHLKWCLYIQDTSLRRKTIIKIKKHIAGLTANISNYRKQARESLFAEIVSTGEQLSAIVIGGFIGKNHCILLPETIGLTCSTNYTNAKYTTLPGKCRDVIESTTDEWQIVPGFYGINIHGEKCLVGRGGTDYTAAEIALKANAEKLLFWKDSLGIQTGDPRMITKATNIYNISIKTLQLMSDAGSGVLHKEVVNCITQAGINVEFWSPTQTKKPHSKLSYNCSTPQKPIIIVSNKKNSHTQLQKATIITKNTTAALVLIGKLRSGYPISNIKLLERYAVAFDVHAKFANTLAVLMHKHFHENYYMKVTHRLSKKEQEIQHYTK